MIYFIVYKINFSVQKGLSENILNVETVNLRCDLL